ncbi:unnamed protein product [Musa hybrid cultivar]
MCCRLLDPAPFDHIGLVGEEDHLSNTLHTERIVES